MLEGLMGAITFTMDKPAYAIGEFPTYRITGAPPGAIIAWTSFKDGAATGEYQADYGHRIGSDGSWSATAVQPWAATDAGLWQKQAVVISSRNSPNDTIETAQYFFSVGAPAGVEPAPGGGDSLFDSSINLFGAQIPVIGLIAVGGVALLVMSRR
jgi:hypothetical protein